MTNHPRWQLKAWLEQHGFTEATEAWPPAKQQLTDDEIRRNMHDVANAIEQQERLKVELIEKIKRDYRNRRWAAEQLGKIGDARTVEPLCRALAGAWDNIAVEVLGKIGAAAVEPLCRALADADKGVRDIAGAWQNRRRTCRGTAMYGARRC